MTGCTPSETIRMLDLDQLAAAGRRTLAPAVPRVSVGTATCGRAAGAELVLNELWSRYSDSSSVLLTAVGCLGACYLEPLVDVRYPGGRHYLYGPLEQKSLANIVRTVEGQPSDKLLLGVFQEKGDQFGGAENLEFIEARDRQFAEFWLQQRRRVSGRCGLISPLSLEEYVAMNGYQALAEALTALKPEEVVDLIEASGLRGRGGAGFPTGRKWRLAAQRRDQERLVIANADEGDPGAYMDRALLESDPHGVLEGLILAGYAVGAAAGYIFVRHEYPLAVSTLQKAIADARTAGLLGKDILKSGYSFEVFLAESAGAFVCGEETSMIKVMEGKRGEPVPRPPFPTTSGLAGLPTVVNNVETLANVPLIVREGPEAFRATGTEQSPGTKIFCLTGDIPRIGFVEVPLGTESRVLVEQIGGGSAEKPPKALQIGGPSGGIVSYHNFSVDYETVTAQGAIMGSGGLVVLSENRCLVDLSRHLVSFLAVESCGKCVACREGLREVETLLESITHGRPSPNILEQLEEVSFLVATASACGLGRTAVNAVLSCLKYFRREFEEHLAGFCPTVNCKELIKFEVIPKMCSSCRCCYPSCPTRAIRGRFGKAHQVDQRLCLKCWACAETCPYGAIKISSGEYVWKS